MIGERLKKLRGKQTQEEVAKKIGISRARYSHYENGRSEPDMELLQKLADFFGVSIDYLLTGKPSGQLMMNLDLENPDQLMESPQHVRFPLRLKKSMDKKGITTKEMASALNISEKDFINLYLTSPASWMPNKETFDLISSILEVSVNYLLGYSNDQNLSSKDEKDIATRMEEIMKDLTKADGLLFSGEPMSEEAIESLLEAMEYTVRQTQRINKKYIPKK